MKRKMQKLVVSVTAMIFTLCLTSQVFAETSSKEECIAKCQEAAQMLLDNKAAAVAEIGNKSGKFVWKDTYVFLMDLNGKMLAHPMKPALTEKATLLGVPDKNKENPKLLFDEFVQLAKEKGDGWVAYMWPKPGEEAPSQKDTYIYRVPGTDMFVAAGTYE